MSACVSVCVLVLLGALVASGSPVHSQCHFVPNGLEEKIKSITEPLELKETAIGGHQLFIPLIDSINCSCQSRERALVLNATLDVYLRIFSRLLQETRGPELLEPLADAARTAVVKTLAHLQHKVEELKRHLNLDRQDTLRRTLSTLDRMNVDDVKVQKKALAEFRWIFQTASVI
uniref:Interleukin-6 n=1 Tax=Myripristis murdjan TaxID=586833 RepID=A0A667WRH5_9TELE